MNKTSAIKIFKTCGYWMTVLLYYTAIILAIGTICGACLFPLIGPFFVDSTAMALAKKGAWMGFRYAGVWAGGTAITLCFFKAGRNKSANGS